MKELSHNDRCRSNATFLLDRVLCRYGAVMNFGRDTLCDYFSSDINRRSKSSMAIIPEISWRIFNEVEVSQTFLKFRNLKESSRKKPARRFCYYLVMGSRQFF